MKKMYDLIVIGAGPAGMAAAVTTSSFGLSVLVVDEQKDLGGQIYHSLENARPENRVALGEDYFYGEDLIRDFHNSKAEYLPETTVWNLDESGHVGILKKDKAYQFKAKHLLIAAGAMERPVPIPGWTLPGVMGSAAADILFKVNDMVPDGPVVLAGSGPLQLLVACRLIDNGVKIAAMIDTTPFGNYLKAIPFFPQALRAAGYLSKGLAMRWKIQKADFPIFLNAKNLAIQGTDSAEEIHFDSIGGSQKIQAKSFLLHEGVVPNIQFTRLLECEHQWYERQRYWKPVLDSWGTTSANSVSVAGDCGGIWGAKAAEKTGHLAAINIAHRLQTISFVDREQAARPLIKELEQEKAIRPFLDQLFYPGQQALVPRSDETLVCRCEEITAGEIRESVSLGAISPGQVKSHTRSGMGPCQARMCGSTLAEVIADSRQVPTSTVGHLKIRPPLKPITLGQLADLEL